MFAHDANFVGIRSRLSRQRNYGRNRGGRRFRVLNNTKRWGRHPGGSRRNASSPYRDRDGIWIDMAEYFSLLPFRSIDRRRHAVEHVDFAVRVVHTHTDVNISAAADLFHA